MIIARYISREITQTMLAVTLVLLVIFITNQFVHYVQVAATGQITMLAVLQLMALQVPMLAGYLLPLGFYLAVLLVLGRLYAESEMTVLQSCGLSTLQLAKIIFTYAVALMVFVAILILWLEPVTQAERKDILERAIGRMSMEKLIAREFRQLPRGGVLYAKSIERSKQHMREVFFAEQGHDKGLTGRPVWDVTIASSADQTMLPQEHAEYLVFKHGLRIIGVPGEKKFRVIAFDQYGVRLSDQKFQLFDWPLDASTASLWKIRNTNREAASMLHWRIGMPVSVLLFALIAFSLSRVKPRQGKFAQFLPAILIYIAYADLMFVGRAWIKQGTVSPLLGLWWLHAAMLLIGLLLLTIKFNLLSRWWRHAYS